MSQEYRDGLFAEPPPPDMKNPIGRWWCPTCNCLSAKCEARGAHNWEMRWMEDKADIVTDPRGYVVDDKKEQHGD